jgi:hypothetical protein
MLTPKTMLIKTVLMKSSSLLTLNFLLTRMYLRMRQRILLVTRFINALSAVLTMLVTVTEKPLKRTKTVLLKSALFVVMILSSFSSVRLLLQTKTTGKMLTRNPSRRSLKTTKTRKRTTRKTARTKTRKRTKTARKIKTLKKSP